MVLVQVCRTNVLYILQAEPSVLIMHAVFFADKLQGISKEHSELLRKNYCTLIKKIDADSVKRILFSKKVLTLDEKKNISHNKQEQAEQLLDTLFCKSDWAFAEFIYALLETEQRHLAVLLLPKLGKICHQANILSFL